MEPTVNTFRFGGDEGHPFIILSQGEPGSLGREGKTGCMPGCAAGSDCNDHCCKLISFTYLFYGRDLHNLFIKAHTIHGTNVIFTLHLP